MNSATKRIIRLPSVQARTGLSRSTIYLRIAEGSFPKQISLGARAIGWIESDVDDWIERLTVRSRYPCPLQSASKVAAQAPGSAEHSSAVDPDLRAPAGVGPKATNPIPVYRSRLR